MINENISGIRVHDRDICNVCEVCECADCVFYTEDLEGDCGYFKKYGQWPCAVCDDTQFVLRCASRRPIDYGTSNEPHDDEKYTYDGFMFLT